MSLITPDPVIILDFGSQLTQNIARRVRELEIYSEVHPPFETADQIRSRNPLAIILSGGPSSVFDPEAPTVDPGIFYLGIPVLGICYGMQLMAHLLGGKVEPAEIREYGEDKSRPKPCRQTCDKVFVPGIFGRIGVMVEMEDVEGAV